MNRYDREKDFAIEAVKQAALVCQTVRANLVSEETIVKKDRSPVTVADFSSQAIIGRYLRRTFPHDPLVAEESASDLLNLSDDTVKQRVFECVRACDPNLLDDDILEALDSGGFEGSSSGRFWTLDPIDGTKGFLRGEQYAISLALIEDGEVAFGVLGCPNYPSDWMAPETSKGLLFVAARNEGAFVRGIEGSQFEPIRVSSIDNPQQAVFCESVESGHSSHDASKEIASRLGVSNPPLRIDSQCKYAAVAKGDASIYLRLPTRADYEEKIWDHAAGVVVLQEAGGKVSDVQGKPLDFSLGRTLKQNKGVVAANESIHDRVVEAVRSVLESN